MARNVALLAFGIVVGVLGGAALSIHAFEEGGSGSDLTGVDGSSEASDSASAEPDLTVGTPAPFFAYGVWDRLAGCEAGGDWHNARNPKYKGGLQFDAPTWARHGGLTFAWRADFATREQQIVVGQRTLAAQGWGAWPTCSRILGLR